MRPLIAAQAAVRGLGVGREVHEQQREPAARVDLLPHDLDPRRRAPTGADDRDLHAGAQRERIGIGVLDEDRGVAGLGHDRAHAAGQLGDEVAHGSADARAPLDILAHERGLSARVRGHGRQYHPRIADRARGIARSNHGWLAAILLALAACGGAPHPTAAPIALALPALDGGDLDVARYRGQVVVLHVFSTGSLAATADVVALDQVADAHTAVVIGVALDLDGRPVVAPWRTGTGARYQVALATDLVRGGASALGDVSTVPVTVVLDRAGRPVARVARQLRDGELAALVARAASSK